LRVASLRSKKMKTEEGDDLSSISRLQTSKPRMLDANVAPDGCFE
jgi:hypothetical protein